MKLFHGDCLEIMPTLPAGSIDAIICDPPFGTTACKWDSVIPFAPMWECFKRLIKPNGAIVLFAAQPFTSALVMSNPEMFRYSWVWEKGLGTGHLRAKFQPLRVHEDICVFCADPNGTYFPQMTKGKMRKKGDPDRTTGVYGKGNADRVPIENDTYYPKSVVSFSNGDHRGRLHPTQKPIALLEYLIRTYTNQGETVLDCTMGSGTAGVACKRTGRKFVGIENDEQYFCVAQNRIAEPFHIQSDLFGEEAVCLK